MESRFIWSLISVVLIQSVWSFNFESRNLTDCWNGGLKCAENLSSCKFDLDNNTLTCFCVAGYTGKLCDEDRNECDVGSAPCKKRGVCHNSIGSFRCDCLPGWQGSHCQTSDGSGLSTCLTGYTGVNCTEDFDECTQWIENPCEHGSTCVNTVGNFTCSCVTGWEGRICNEDINECNLTSGLCHNGGNCTNIPGSYKCVCPYPYTGPACDDISSTTSTTTTTTTPIPITSATATGAISSTSSVSRVSLGISTVSPGVVATTGTVGSTAFSATGKVQLSSRQPSTTVGRASTSTSALSQGHVSFGQTSPTVGGVSRSTIGQTQSSSGQPTGPGASNHSPQRQNSGEQNDSGGGTNTGAIVGPIVGVFVVAGAAGAGYFVYNKYYRNHPKVDPANDTAVEKAKMEKQTNDVNRNTKWKPQDQETKPNTDTDPPVNGIETTP